MDQLQPSTNADKLSEQRCLSGALSPCATTDQCDFAIEPAHSTSPLHIVASMSRGGLCPPNHGQHTTAAGIPHPCRGLSWTSAAASASYASRLWVATKGISWEVAKNPDYLMTS